MPPGRVGRQDRPILLETMSEVVLNAAGGRVQASCVDVIFDEVVCLVLANAGFLRGLVRMHNQWR